MRAITVIYAVTVSILVIAVIRIVVLILVGQTQLYQRTVVASIRSIARSIIVISAVVSNSSFIISSSSTATIATTA